MRILITNDDGIQSSGIEALVNALYKEHEVVVSAPANQQSAKSHAITVRSRLYVTEYTPLQEKYGIKALAVGGTPADAVKLYVEGMASADERPDLVISGINDGSNAGTDLLYSGTVGAATEGFVQGINAIAVSLDYNAEIDFDFVAKALIAKLPALLQRAEAEKKLFNINFPKKIAQDCKWICCRQGIRDYNNAYQSARDEEGRLYYTVGGTPIDTGNTEDTDVFVTEHGHIAVSSLKLEKTRTDDMFLGQEL